MSRQNVWRAEIFCLEILLDESVIRFDVLSAVILNGSSIILIADTCCRRIVELGRLIEVDP